jgi:small subunit ribosomal protein S1
VTSLADFGAFVNINGADGLVHLSEISWEHIQNPAEVLKVGQEVKVKVISIDRDKKRIGLSIRQLQDDPWSDKASKYIVGQLVEGKITQLTKFGAFARLDDDIEGLIHISEISEKRIDHPREVLHEGDELTLRVIKIDPANPRIGLSLRKVDSMAYADMDWQTLNESLLENGETPVETPTAEPTETKLEPVQPESAEPTVAETETMEPESAEPEKE